VVARGGHQSGCPFRVLYDSVTAKGCSKRPWPNWLSPDTLLVLSNHWPVIPAIEVFTEATWGRLLVPTLDSLINPPTARIAPTKHLCHFHEVTGARYLICCVDYDRSKGWKTLVGAASRDLSENSPDMTAVFPDRHSSLLLDLSVSDRGLICTWQHLGRQVLIRRPAGINLPAAR
jgi:hypothetical protein